MAGLRSEAVEVIGTALGVSGRYDAERAHWHEAGALNGLLCNNQPMASYWVYRW